MQQTITHKLWYGVYGKEYVGSEPAFFDAQQFEWAKTLTSNHEVIVEELAPLMHEKNTDLKPYFDDDIQFPPKNWKTIGFYFWGKKNRKVCRRFPKTEAILKQIPGLISASFNMLEPNSVIKPHFGDTNAVYRAHLGIKIPTGLPDCGFVVKGESRPWKEGELLIFLDANVHEAFNKSPHRRYILLIDVLRPEFIKQKTNVCSNVLAMLSLYYILALHPSFIRIAKKFSERVIDGILYPIKMLWIIYFLVMRVSSFKN